MTRERDQRILGLYDAGLSTREIADQLEVSQSTASRVIRRSRPNEPRRNSAYVRSDYVTVTPMVDRAQYKRHTLYRFFDDAEVLLYVGITDSLLFRLDQHARIQPWFEDVTSVRLAHYESREELLRAEELAIKTEKPRHNRVHGDSRPWAPRA